MLDKLLGSRLRARVIGWLFTHPDERFYVRQLQGLLKEDATNLGRELARLERMRVVTCEARGREKFYQANLECAVFEELRGLAVKTVGMADVLKEALEPLADRIAVAFIFGSQARGDVTAESDIDVMVVGDVSFGEVVHAFAPKQLDLNREINPHVYAANEFWEKVNQGHYFVGTVARGPKIYLVGQRSETEHIMQATKSEHEGTRSR